MSVERRGGISKGKKLFGRAVRLRREKGTLGRDKRTVCEEGV